MINFLLVRHAESKWVEYARKLPKGEERFGGRMNDVELSADGWPQAEAHGRYMRCNGIRPTHYVSSPAKRARQTHEGSQRGMGMQPPASLVIVEDLQEMTWGDWERQPRSLAQQPHWVREREQMGFDFFPPGNGESYNLVRGRALRALRSVVRRVPDGSTVCVYTHQNVIKALVYPALGWSYEQTMAASLGVVSMTSLRYSVGKFTLGFFNQQTLPVS